MTSTITWKAGGGMQIEYIECLNEFVTPEGRMKATKFHKWLKELSRQKCTHEETKRSNAGLMVHQQYRGEVFEKTNYKLCQYCKTKI